MEFLVVAIVFGCMAALVGWVVVVGQTDGVHDEDTTLDVQNHHGDDL